jgi:GMP synthase (glutamine-hydrolysing)
MNVEDQHRRPHLKTELNAIERALEQGKPVLGICLGAQLLAHVLGAPVQRHRQAEIGWYDLQVSADGRGDTVLGAAGEQLPVFQWHSYSYELPLGATHLARTATCEQQAFRFGSNAYGFQFHLEADEAVIERWLTLPSFRTELAAAGLPTDEHAIRSRNCQARRRYAPHGRRRVQQLSRPGWAAEPPPPAAVARYAGLDGVTIRRALSIPPAREL